jgi:hypothetical protein
MNLENRRRHLVAVHLYKKIIPKENEDYSLHSTSNNTQLSLLIKFGLCGLFIAY